MQKLLIATHNQGKVEEYRALLAELPLDVISLDDAGITVDVEETGTTFVENARLKAETYAQMAGVWSWADDSGLEVDALNGRPGVYSARYGGAGATDQERYTKLLAEMQGVPDAERTARFRCVVALCDPAGRTYTCDGTVEGQIAREPRGEYGFGYDPVFYLPDLGATMAELPPTVKNRISHRGQAARAAQALLHELLAGKVARGQRIVKDSESG